MGTPFESFRQACRRLAGTRCDVEVLAYDTPAGWSLREPPGGEGEFVDYRQVVAGDLPDEGAWMVVARVNFPSRPSEEREFWVNGDGAWRDRSCLRPLFTPAVARKPARDAMADRVGRQRVEAVEAALREAVDEILGLKALRREGFSWTKKPEVAFRWANRLSRGGVNGVIFGPARLALLPEESGTFREYAAFAGDPMIGSFRGTRKDCLRVLAAHEMAHWLQYDREVTRPPGRYKEPHGSGFRKIYWILRDAMGLKANMQPSMKP